MNLICYIGPIGIYIAGLNTYNMSDKKSYKDIHGETRVGKFLRSIKKSGIVGKAIDAASDLSTGNILGALKTILVEDNSISPEDRAFALEQLRLDIEGERGVTQRWTSDMRFGNFVTKTIRPFILLSLTVAFIVCFFMKEYQMDIIGNMLSIVLTAYFGSRGAEKIFGAERK
jgi:hypothetical protein